MSSEYTGKNIQVLKDLEHVRKRPAMYIGTTGPDGVHHLIWELIDNAVDEAGMGHGDKITVTLEKNDYITVTDRGRGIPIDIHEEAGVSTLQVVMTQLHAGGKFDDQAYKTSGGLHGVGASVVNALARECTVRVQRDNKIATQTYERGIPQNEVKIEKKNSRITGTTISFKPDTEIFPDIRIDETIIAERLHDLSYLLPEVTFILEDQRPKEYRVREYHSEKGLPEFVEHQLEDKDCMLKKTFYMDETIDNAEIEIAFNYDKDGHSENIVAYANNIKTEGGGTHVQGFKTALTRAVKEVSDSNGNFQGADLREGLMAVISVKIPEPQFEGQTKGKLGNPEVRGHVSKTAYDRIYKYMSKNPSATEGLVKKAQGAAKARKAAKQARDITREASKDVSMALSSKLSGCIENKMEGTELFLVEGDSAGGSAKQARDRHFQAILPLKGKIKNVQKATASTYLKNTEIQAIITAVGTGVGENFDIHNLRYEKIIIMCDPDVDGLHIQTLLLTLFYNCMPELIDRKHLYIADPPLYYQKTKEGTEYLYGAQEDLGDGDIRRFKGLGEMNPEELWETTMDPETRRLIEVTAEDVAATKKMLEVCMGRKVKPRRELIQERARGVWEKLAEKANV
ncbi:MAG: type IIA DNA topoisomerase subunit B [bacterium]